MSISKWTGEAANFPLANSGPGSKAAAVTFAGSPTGLISGMLQINAVPRYSLLRGTGRP